MSLISDHFILFYAIFLGGGGGGWKGEGLRNSNQEKNFLSPTYNVVYVNYGQIWFVKQKIKRCVPHPSFSFQEKKIFQ